MEINDILNSAPELWGVIGMIIGTLALSLGGVAVVALAGTKMLEYGKMFWAEIKGQRAAIYNAVDEATDAIPQEFAKFTPFQDSPEMWSSIMRAAIEVAMDYKPPQVNIEAQPNAE